jgi:two-component system, LytTR family, sensor kinase
MDPSRAHPLIRRLPDLPLALASITGFWLFYFATVVIRSALIDQDFQGLGVRALGCLVGVALTGLVWLVLNRAAQESIRVQVVAAAIACLPAAAIFATFNLAFFLYQPLATQTFSEKGENGVVTRRAPTGEYRIERKGAPAVVLHLPSTREIILGQASRVIGEGIVTWYFFFAAWASFYIAMSSAARLRAAERRAVRAEREAQTAQLRALRYQVNPHFLFNTLNALSSLVMSRRPDEAETMIVNLSTFFRTSLALDPGEDISLEREIEFQQLYLDIEKVRFPDRLDVRIEVPADLYAARIPPLLLQPLVENAIKHGVARTAEPVTLSIAAREEDARLILSVENDRGPKDPSGGGGGGVGVANVRARLAARFGREAECEQRAIAGGGYRVTLTMPLELDGATLG